MKQTFKVRLIHLSQKLFLPLNLQLFANILIYLLEGSPGSVRGGPTSVTHRWGRTRRLWLVTKLLGVLGHAVRLPPSSQSSALAIKY